MRDQSSQVVLIVLALTLIVVATPGCAPRAETPAGTAAAQAPQQPRLPVSLNEVMAALVNHAADPIWVADWREPETDKEWRELVRHSLQLQLAGSLLQIPGTGALDDEWAGHPDWRRWGQQLRESGELAQTALSARDGQGIRTAGDRIVAVCEGCHTQFKPDLPTGAIYGELSPTAADFEDAKDGDDK